MFFDHGGTNWLQPSHAKGTATPTPAPPPTVAVVPSSGPAALGAGVGVLVPVGGRVWGKTFRAEGGVGETGPGDRGGAARVGERRHHQQRRRRNQAVMRLQHLAASRGVVSITSDKLRNPAQANCTFSSRLRLGSWLRAMFLEVTG